MASPSLATTNGSDFPPRSRITTTHWRLPERLKARRRSLRSSAQLAEKLATVGVTENERNLNNKISRGGFSAAFMLQCLEAIGASSLALSLD